MIKNFKIKNLGGTQEFIWSDLGRINLIIGSNGCGKSALLHELYAPHTSGAGNPSNIKMIADGKLHGYFDLEQIYKLSRDASKRSPVAQITIGEAVEVTRRFFNASATTLYARVVVDGLRPRQILNMLAESDYVKDGSIVLIDDVEAHLDPRAVSDMLDTVALLAKKGAQFFITSHSYFVIKKLFLIAQEQKMSVPVLSYQDDKWVQSDLLEDIADNPIIDESIRLYKEEVNLAFGE